MVEWNGGMEWWNGIMECVLWGERSLLMQFSMKVTPVEAVKQLPLKDKIAHKGCVAHGLLFRSLESRD